MEIVKRACGECGHGREFVVYPCSRCGRTIEAERKPKDAPYADESITPQGWLHVVIYPFDRDHGGEYFVCDQCIPDAKVSELKATMTLSDPPR